MTIDLVFLVLLCGAAFLAGVAVTLVLSERRTSARDRHQARRERELAEFSAYLDEQLRMLATAERKPIASAATPELTR